MALVKKINSEWKPVEHPNLQVGDVIEKTNYERLVMEGNAVLVDENGNELPLPGKTFTCPICFTNVNTMNAFVSHIDSHKKPAAPVAETPVVDNGDGTVSPVTETVTASAVDEAQKMADTRAKRLAALEKARAARAAKKGQA